jgi:deoxyribose-phosphate aldolase
MSPHPIEDRARSFISRIPASPAYTGVPPWLGHDAGSIHGIGRYLDHTLLKPEATRDQVLKLCDEAARFGVKAVCVNGCWVETCVTRLRGSGVLVATVVGFPLGAMTSAAKAAETQLALAAGAREVDMVVPIGHVRSGEWGYVEHDIRTVAMAAAPGLVKVILETAALEPIQIAAACLAARAAGAGFVKTSTGFHPAGGATVEAVSLMRRAAGSEMGVKASGGIRTPEAAIMMLAAGASRIGTSNTAEMSSFLGPSALTLAELFAVPITVPPSPAADHPEAQSRLP